MQSNREKLSERQISKLIADLNNVPEQPAGEHLSEQEMGWYVHGALAGVYLQRIESHLESCCECTTILDALFEANEQWNTPKTQKIQIANGIARLVTELGE